MMANYLPRRVVDTAMGKHGTAVWSYGRDLYRVEWDDPTPYQDVAQVPIPSKFFAWDDSATVEQCR